MFKKLDNIYIGTNIIEQILISKYKKLLSQRLILITDNNVKELHANDILKKLEAENLACDLISIPAGEQSKTREQKQLIEDKLFQLGCTRDTTIIAVGGGVVTDLAGFIASTFCRGIPVIYIPTTLLAMVDAAIGGKTGVNTIYGKNLIGSFYHPSAVICDVNTLKTLPKDEFGNGLIETIKHGLLASPKLLSQIEQYYPDFSSLQLIEIIYASCKIKSQFVEQDTHDKNIRSMLNLGHTIGHAIERLFHYEIGHGQAVQMGLIIEAKIAVLKNIIPESIFDKIFRILNQITFSKNFQISKSQVINLIDFTSYDKKARQKQARYVFISDIGKPYHNNGQYCIEIEPEVVKQALSYYAKQI